MDEFRLTVAFVKNGAEGLGWNATIGTRMISMHISPEYWGWNARAHSRDYLAVEFAQSLPGDLITDDQIKVFCWWFKYAARVAWPSLPLHFPCHSELRAGLGDGKTDPYPVGPEADAFRDRILGRLEAMQIE